MRQEKLGALINMRGVGWGGSVSFCLSVSLTLLATDSVS